MDTMTAIIGLCSGAVGALLAAFVSVYFSSRKARQNLALDLHREFSSPAFYSGRVAGEQAIKEGLPKTIDQLHQEMPPDEYATKFAVLGFFERVSVCYTTASADRVLIDQLFGEKFMFWWFIMERAGLFKTKWDYAEHWRKLRIAMSKHATDYPKWVEKASAHSTSSTTSLRPKS